MAVARSSIDGVAIRYVHPVCEWRHISHNGPYDTGDVSGTYSKSDSPGGTGTMWFSVYFLLQAQLYFSEFCIQHFCTNSLSYMAAVSSEIVVKKLTILFIHKRRELKFTCFRCSRSSVAAPCTRVEQSWNGAGRQHCLSAKLKPFCWHRRATRGGFAGGGRRHPPRRPWVSHEEGENNEKIDTVDTILIHSGNIASSMLTQWSHVMMFAIVIFKICRQLLRASLLRPWAPLGTSVSQTLGSFRLLFVAQVSMCYISSLNARSWVDCRIKKTRHLTLAHNFTNYGPIFKILSLLDSVGNL